MKESSGEREHLIFGEPPVRRAESASFITRIPQQYMAKAGRLLGRLVYALDRRHRRIVKRNLSFAYPDWSIDRIQELTEDVFQHMGIMALELCQLSRFSREDILGKVQVRGRANLLTAVKDPKGFILISAHLGNWEMVNVFISCHVRTPLAVVARRVRPNILNNWINRLRSRFGSVVVDKGGALPKIASTLRRNSSVALVIDQGTLRSEGVEISFFGRTVTATPAAAILARRYNRSVVPGFCIREKDGSLTVIVEPALVLQKTSDVGNDIRANTQIMNDAIERVIRAYPEQWFWFHKRWKRHYPHLYPEDLAKQRRRKEEKKARLRKMQERPLS